MKKVSGDDVVLITVEDARRLLEELGVYPVWSDSMGVKSYSLLVRTSHGEVFIDPGAAALQPGFPLPSIVKRELRVKAIHEIAGLLREAEYVVITHYHHDHFLYPSDRGLGNPYIYRGKTLYIKDPNKYINKSQWGRSRVFLSELLRLAGSSLEEHLTEPLINDFPDPVEELEYAHRRNYGDYAPRRRELLMEGRKWFESLKETWSNGAWIREPLRLGDGTSIFFADEKELLIGSIRLRFTEPLFHGVEYDRTGWVASLWLEARNYKLFISSDLMGPIIEDYAYMIIDNKPDIVFMDGPPVYLFPYMMNRINLNRAIENIKLIIDSQPLLIVYDHHLLRSPKWRMFAGEVLDYASKKGVLVTTYAWLKGLDNVADTVSGSSR